MTRATVSQFSSKGPRPFAGLSLARPLVMGIINVTPDSFSDGGEVAGEDAVQRGKAMLAAGADILDVGGESTRPGAAPVSIADELARILPVVTALSKLGAVVSIDTRKAAIMTAAVDAGATVINDVTALEGEADSLAAAAQTGAAVILMHMQGEPGTMQDNPVYDDAPADVAAYLAGRIAACEAAGIPRTRIAVDPGIGFGKTVDHNLEILARLDEIAALGCPVVLGTSRKSFIGHLAGANGAKDRLAGSLASALAGVARGADILRVHDVAETVQAVKVWQAIEGAP